MTTFFHWWDDALDVANRRARLTGRRHRVVARLGYWAVYEAGAVAMSRLTLATANVYTANRQQRALVEALEDSGADVTGGQEAWWIAHVQGTRRLRADIGAGRGGLEVPIFLGRDLDYHGHGAYRVHRAIPGSRVAKERWITWARFLKDGQRCALINTHVNAALQEPDGDVFHALRVELAKRHMKAILREVRAQRAAGYLPFVTGDFNYRPREGQAELWHWSPQKALPRAGLRYIARGLDGIAYPRALTVRTAGPLTLPGSDHSGLVATIHLPARRDARP